jgi:hypothetical protein
MQRCAMQWDSAAVFSDNVRQACALMNGRSDAQSNAVEMGSVKG